MPRREDEKKVEELQKAEVPGAMEAMTDEGAAQARASHAEEVERLAVSATGGDRRPAVPSGQPAPRFPGEAPSPAIPDESRPGLGPPLRATTVVGDPKVVPVEEDGNLLNLVQDPYNERNPSAVPMIPVKDSYGNVVMMPV